jgi:hypothetical protein
MKKEVFVLILLGVFFFNLGLVQGSYNFYEGNLSRTSYIGGEVIEGEINISFSNQENSNFTDNFDNEISLLDALELSGMNNGIDYSCNPGNCLNGFSSLNGESSKILNLAGEKKVGFRLTGEDIEIEGLSFDLRGDIGETCSVSQVNVDFFDDGKIDFTNSRYVDSICGEKIYGCFDANSGTELREITDTPFCQKISLKQAPSYRFGAKIKNSTEGEEELIMKLLDLDGLELGKCTLPGLTENEQEIDCIINYSVKKEEDYFVCLESFSNFGNYFIRKENIDSCGTFGYDFDDLNADYEIYAKRLKYGVVDFSIDGSSFDETDEFNEFLQDYVDDVYDSDCSVECVIPVSFSGLEQNLEVENIDFDYLANDGPGVSNSVYDIDEKKVEISSEGIVFDLEDFNFSVENLNGLRNYEILFDGEELFNEQVSIESGFDFTITPNFGLIGVETEIEVVTSMNVTEIVWNFGDGDIQTTTNKKVSHRYEQGGNYNLEIQVKTSTGNSKKKFKFLVGEPEESARTLIKDYDLRIGNLTEDLGDIDLWIKEEIEKGLDISLIKSELEIIRGDFNIASTEEDYIEIINALLLLDIPYSILKGQTGEAPLGIGFSGINTNYIEELSLKEVNDDSSLRDAIIGWYNQNYDVNIGFRVYSKLTGNGQEDILKVFEMDISKVSDYSGEVYLIIEYPFDGIKFSEDYGENSLDEGGATYLRLNSQKIKFLIDSNIDFENLGVYVSPDISKLSFVEGDITPGGEKEFNYTRFFIGLLIVIIVFLVLWIIVQEWYKRRYESYLFPDRDQLYNLVNFIFNSRRARREDSQTKKSLAKSGWKGEQITYGFKKIDGKRTGLWEIPVFKFLEKRKVDKEIQRRQENVQISQSGNGNTRFIK